MIKIKMHSPIVPAAVSLSALYLGLPVWAAGDISTTVKTSETPREIVVDNGAVTVVFSKAKGQVTAIRYHHDGRETEMANTMYYSYSAGPTGKGAPKGGSVTAPSLPVHIVKNDAGGAEVAMEYGPTPTYPFQTEIHYVIPRGESGFYVYQIYKHTSDMPAATIGEARFVIKGKPGTDLYTNHVVDAKRMGPFPASPVVKKVMDATFLHEDGTIYTKYNNSAFMADHFVHGMAGHGLAIWMINASNEYVNGGPIKQELTVHEDNTLLNMLEGAHFGSGVLNFNDAENWTKFYGPFFVYMNHGDSVPDMYADALRRAADERQKWPYNWVRDPNFPTNRGTVNGRIALSDGSSTNGAWIILAGPGGDWPLQGKGYEFWTQAGSGGRFLIPKVRPGRYTLYAYGANQFEQYSQDDIVVDEGKSSDLGTLTWKPIRHGQTLWQIGKPDRSTQEFREGADVRHWANYMRYPADFPDDVTYTIGKSHEDKDWNFAQWTWYSKKPNWTIRFDTPKPLTGTCTLTFGIASSNPVRGNHANVIVSVNGKQVSVLRLPKSGPAAYRSGGQDSLYQVLYMTFDAELLKSGMNEITLGHEEAAPFPTPEIQMHGQVGEVMYDAIRLEVEDMK